MKAAVVGGAGKMALGIILDLVENKNVEEILLLDINEEALAARQQQLACDKVKTAAVNIHDTEAVGKLLQDIDTTVNASSHVFNMPVMEACLVGESGYTDLGGLYHWALEQLKRHDDFKKAGITGIVGSGSCPGLVSVMAKYGYEQLDTVESVKIYDGLDNFTEPGYTLVPPYAMKTVLEEFSADNYEFRDGKPLKQPAFSGLEEYDFGYKMGKRTVYDTIHSEPATMPISFADKGIKNVFFKLSLQKTFEERMRFLVGIGMASEEPIQVGDAAVSPKDFFAALIDKHVKGLDLDPNAKPTDYKVLKVEVEGTKDGVPQVCTVESEMEPYEPWNMSMGAFTVGFPAAVTARMIGDGRISEKGFFASEQVIDCKEYFAEIAKRGIYVYANMKQQI